MKIIINIRALLIYVVVFLFIEVFKKSEFKGKSNVWLINEKMDEARDNGYSFYKYMKQVDGHDSTNVYYLIKKGTTDSKKVDKESVVYLGSFRHIYYLLISDVLITSQSLPYYGSYQLFKKLDFLHKKTQKRVWLQHGVTKDMIPYDTMRYCHNHYDMVSCTNHLEKDFISKYYDYPQHVLKVIGFCRYDSLIDKTRKYKNILIMPTHRKWLSKLSVEGFEKSEYFKKYVSLMNDPIVIELLQKRNIKIFFYPHYALQKYINSFEQVLYSKNVIIASKDKYDVQELLKSCQLLITDYSSVAFDFAYQKKPVIYYQFDSEKYASEHYGQGYFCYDRDGFGPVVYSKNELTSFILDYEEKGMPNIYQEKVNNFFELRDTNNCKRTHANILELLEK